MGDRQTSVVRISQHVRLDFGQNASSSKLEHAKCYDKEWNGIRYVEIHEQESPAGSLKSPTLCKPKSSPLSKHPSSGNFFALKRQIQETERAIADVEEQERRSRIIQTILEKVLVVLLRDIE